MEKKMILEDALNELIECADGETGIVAELARELVEVHASYNAGEFNKEEFEFLVKEIADVKAANGLANDEAACRWICECAEVLLMAV
jgi:hypothetical protein